ncbi:hypothetical protein EA58_20685 [Photobacterium galatheae]|uniref:Uncharacterized protein n=1 Tax=Photobacterium galatheae TaxID=1654360 RepID=A0A066RHE2_9GAMM|nr:hypothetical protein EA58_20685 [Photobacterium galatheae]
MCFQDSGQQAVYYYQRYKTPITLTLKDGFWVEQGDTGRWELSGQPGNHIAGQWSTVSGTKSLPLSLKFEYHDLDKNCGEEEFLSALQKTLKWKKGAWKDWFGWQYRDVAYGGDNSIELAANFPSSKVINTIFNDRVTSEERAERQLETLVYALEHPGSEKYDETYVAPVFLNGLWLGVRFYVRRAGTGANGTSDYTSYFSLATGEMINPWRWFLSSQVNQPHEYSAYSHPLPETMRAKYGRKESEASEFEGCKRSEHGYYQISLRNNGLLFWERPNGDGCEREFLLTPEAAMPFANAEGKKALSAFSKLIRLNLKGY